MKKTNNKTKKNVKTEDNNVRKKIIWILWTTIIMIIGLILFKYIPMYLYGEYILFDASSHVAWTTWGLYILWFFVAPKKSWRIPYFIFAGVVIVIIAIQRIIAGAHNLVGVILGLAVISIAIVAPRWNEFRKGVYF